MKTAKTFIIVICLTVMIAGCGRSAKIRTATQVEARPIVIGTFDSRAIAIAFTNSDYNEKRLQEKKKEMKKAKAAGDKEKIAELEKWGNDMQQQLHRQGFGVADVSDLLKYVEGKIPYLAADTGVDIIVSKWDVVHSDPTVSAKDITKELAMLFEPDKKAIKWIEQIQNHPPAAAEDIEKHHDH